MKLAKPPKKPKSRKGIPRKGNDTRGALRRLIRVSLNQANAVHLLRLEIGAMRLEINAMMQRDVIKEKFTLVNDPYYQQRSEAVEGRNDNWMREG